MYTITNYEETFNTLQQLHSFMNFQFECGNTIYAFEVKLNGKSCTDNDLKL